MHYQGSYGYKTDTLLVRHKYAVRPKNHSSLVWFGLAQLQSYNMTRMVIKSYLNT